MAPRLRGLCTPCVACPRPLAVCRSRGPALRVPALSAASDRAAAATAAGRTTLPPSPPAAGGTAGQQRCFSSTPSLERISTQRKNMYMWLQRHGKRFVGAPEHASNYLGPLPNQPFPMNPLFRSQPVLSESTREEIWHHVIKLNESLKTVSAVFNVDVRRVAAVVRMKQIEKMWQAQGKPLANAYAKAVLDMLPQTRHGGPKDTPHESIGDIHGHSAAMRQLFLPTSESRRFTREDAAKAFNENLLPADERTPHPELVTLERELMQGKNQGESFERFQATTRASEKAVAAAAQNQKRILDESIQKVKTERFEFRFQDVSVHSAGRDGKSIRGVGWRYGVPHFDRKRGQIKIPTQVPDVPKLN